MSAAPFSGLVVDRLACDRRAGQLSFAVGPGERVYVCGEGAGGVLLAIAGFVPPLSGRVVCDGRELTGIAPPARHVAYIPGGDSLIGHRSLLANVCLPGTGRAEAAAALARLGLPEAAGGPVAALPPEQRRLGALARALATHPALLLVDEAADDPPAIPDRLAGLDRPGALVAGASAAVALARADRILLLHGGHPVQFGTARDLYERPADRAAALWSADCNLLPAMLDGAGPTAASVRVRIGEMSGGARRRGQVAGPALLAIRPQALRLTPDGLPASVRSVDYRGFATRLVLDAAGTRLILDVDTETASRLAPGGAVRVGWDWSDAWPLAAPRVRPRRPSRRAAALAAALLLALAAAAALSLLLPPLLAVADHLLTVPLTRRLALTTLRLAALCTAISLLLGAPLAWAMRLAEERLRRMRGVAAASPFILGVLGRAAGFLIVLGEFGLVNLVLRALRVETEIPRRSAWLTELTVLGGMVQVFAPFMVLALYRPMARIDIGTVRALRSLGLSHAAIFLRVAVPLSRGGAAAGVATVFALATGAYVTVAMFGQRRVQALASLAYDQSTALIGWQIAALAIGLGGFGLWLAARWLRLATVQRVPNSRTAASRTRP